MYFNKCNVCLLENAQLISINEVDLNNVKWYNKIILIVPELVTSINMPFFHCYLQQCFRSRLMIFSFVMCAFKNLMNF